MRIRGDIIPLPGMRSSVIRAMRAVFLAEESRNQGIWRFLGKLAAKSKGLRSGRNALPGGTLLNADNWYIFNAY